MSDLPTDGSERLLWRPGIPSPEERAADADSRGRGLPPVRHAVLLRYERLFDVWRVTLAQGNTVLRECRFNDDHKLEEMIRRGRGMSCLEDRQSVERGMQQGLGATTLHLDAEQYAAISSPL